MGEPAAAPIRGKKATLLRVIWMICIASLIFVVLVLISIGMKILK